MPGRVGSPGIITVAETVLRTVPSDHHPPPEDEMI